MGVLGSIIVIIAGVLIGALGAKLTSGVVNKIISIIGLVVTVVGIVYLVMALF